jgi:4-hydroxy-2,2'-bipyrrole-5-methanol synthase
MRTLADFYLSDARNVFDKCARFDEFVADLKAAEVFQALFRLEVEGPLDHEITVRDPFGGGLRQLVCFDSNSYLGLHLHPRVVAAVHRTLDVAGYGTPSAQLLAGTSRWLCELEETVSAFHGRAAAMVFPSGYATNVGALTGLLRPGDTYACDQLSHASIHDGCRWSGAKGRAYRHLDIADLDRHLERDRGAARAALIVSDGVFSMHGRLAPLPQLRAAADRHDAALMIDEAHSVGIIGASGRGLEERFGCPGAIDVLMGTFSKAPGGVGGYVCGSGEMVQYLRFFARAGMFTASLPAATCAGLTEAFRVMEEEPEHRERLWRVARRLWSGLRQSGFALEAMESPILTVPVGDISVLLEVGRALFEAGFKCGSVSYPAVPRRESLLRVTANARHTDENVDRFVEALARIARASGILGLSFTRSGAPAEAA